MKTIHEIKRFLKSEFGISVRGNSSTGKGQWQGVYIPNDRSVSHLQPLQYNQPPFPPEFRNFCLRTIYPTSPGLCLQTSGGNVSGYMLSLHAHEWEIVINGWAEAKKQYAAGGLTFNK